MNDLYYTTVELEFLDSLGSNSQAGSTMDKSELLKRYLNSLDKRTNFGRLNKNEIRQHALKLLFREKENEHL